jgi:hypothetical protein
MGFCDQLERNAECESFCYPNEKPLLVIRISSRYVEQRYFPSMEAFVVSLVKLDVFLVLYWWIG